MKNIRKIIAIMVIAALCLSGTVLAEEAPEITAHDFLGEWVDQDGTTNIDVEAREEGDGYIFNVQTDVFDEDYDYIVWAYGCVYDEETHTMKSLSRATGTGSFDPDSEEEIADVNFEYTDAEFYFDDDGILIWDDKNEEADDGMLFEHTIGWVDPDYVGPGHHFVGEWDAVRMSITIDETMDGYEVAVLASGGAFNGAYWAYTCYYDEETDSLLTDGQIAEKHEYTYSEDGNDYKDELIYDDGVAMFRLNEEGQLLWYDKNENAGEGWVFDFVSEEETAGNIIAPVDPGYDLTALGDGIYPVYFAPADLADGELTFSAYSEDVYDLVDIGRIAVGDTFWLGGLDFEVESVERGDDLYINGGMDNGGFTLRSYDEDNCWRVVMEDDGRVYTDRGETSLPLSDDVTFTDNWDGGEMTAAGAEAVAEAISGTEMDYFSPYNTYLRVEEGKIVEIDRVYLSIFDEPVGKIVTPNNPEIDIEALADGIYPAAFEQAALADGAMTFTVYWEDTFDIVEISQLAPGDALYVGDTLIDVETVEREDDLLINGGLDNGGVTLRAYEEDNVWKAVVENDEHTYMNWGETTLPVSDDVTFTDGWDIENDPVTVTGAEAVAEAITGAEMDAFIPENTTVRVEDGRIVEIVRVYMP